MKPLPAFVALLALVVLGASCKRQEPVVVTSPAPDAVAVVGGHAIPRAALERELARRGPGSTRDAVLGEMIRFEATLARARSSGFDQDPAIRTAIEQLLVSRFEERELAGTEAPAVSEDEVRARYQADTRRYRVPAAGRGALLFLKAIPKAGPEQREALVRKARQLHGQASVTDVAGFTRLIREQSEDQASRYQGGDTGWVTASGMDGWEPSVTEALLALKGPGETAPLIETPRGFHIVRLAEIRGATVHPLAGVSEAIRHQIQQEKRARLIVVFHSRMEAGLDIQTNFTVLQQIPTSRTTASVPPSMP